MNLYNNDEIQNYTTIIDEINLILLDKTKSEISIDNININDLIYICFYPNSQKYIYSLIPKLGKVISCKNDNQENNIEIKILNYKNEIESLLYSSVSYMNHSLGYEYQIYLVK